MALPSSIPGWDRLAAEELTGDVHNAIRRLKELGSQMRNQSYQFSSKDLESIDELAKYLKELDSKRINARDRLEAETIKSSIVRRELSHFPEKTIRDIEDKVHRARVLNEDQIGGLQAEIARIAEETKATIRKQELLSMHNDLLQAEEKKLSECYEVKVKELNSQMAERARLQIELNGQNKDFKDTVKKSNSVKQEIQDVEVQMKEVMSTFAKDMLNLNKTLEDAKAQYEETMEKNIDLEKQFCDLKGDVVEQDLLVEEKLSQLKRSEARVKYMRSTEANTRKQIKEGTQQIERLKEQSSALKDQAKRFRQEYEGKEEVVAEKRSQLRKQMKLISADSEKLTFLCRGLKRELKTVCDEAEAQERVLADIKAKVHDTKKTLITHSEEGVELKEDSNKMITELNELLSAHQQSVMILNNEITELRKRLEEGTRTANVVQSGYDDATQTVQDKTSHHQATMAILQRRMETSTKIDAEMTERATFLEDSTAKCCEDTKAFDSQLKESSAKLIRTKRALSNAISSLEENISDLREEIGDRNETLARIKPQCVTLEKEHERLSDVYDTEKRELIALKSQKSEMQDRIKELQANLAKMSIPQQELKMDTLRCRAYTRQIVWRRTHEVDRLEKEVTEANQKVGAIQKENKRIVEGSQVLSDEIKRMHGLLGSRKDVEDQLDANLQEYKDRLSEQRQKNKDLEMASSARDQLVLQDITALRKASETRHELLSGLHGQFEQELKGFSDYLLKTATQSATV